MLWRELALSRQLHGVLTNLSSNVLTIYLLQQHTLLSDKRVQAYLGLTEDAQNDQASPSVANEEPDFS